MLNTKLGQHLCIAAFVATVRFQQQYTKSLKSKPQNQFFVLEVPYSYKYKQYYPVYGEHHQTGFKKILIKKSKPQKMFCVQEVPYSYRQV